MATRIESGAGTRVIGSHVPLNVALGVIPQLPRPMLAQFIERAIERLDIADGDTDLEPYGDELDGSLGEDDFCDHNLCFAGPGCPVSDPDCCAARDDDLTHGGDDGRPGDPEDAEDEGDNEAVGMVPGGGSEE